jgi:ribosomal protein L17
MPTAKEYREYVDECIGWAKSAETDDERDIFLQMAKSWMEAALIANGASPGPTAWTRPPSDEDGSATA